MGPRKPSRSRERWSLVAHYSCYDLRAFIREGYSWKKNLIPELCFYAPTTKQISQDPAMRWKYLRSWGIREFPENPDKSRWKGNITGFADTVKTLAQFRLTDLTTENLRCVTAYSPVSYPTFVYDREDPENNIDCMNTINDGHNDSGDDGGSSAPHWTLPPKQSITEPESSSNGKGSPSRQEFGFKVTVDLK
ncbi:hypothetical protein QBC40DRAFT_261458 [Triangularia verruculosa]|uniref:Uncharacterized protein n=1 Tax=Triangularia verruculosa TaxID=2587418 RepID=A0AAN6XPF8_9PEZI|nr:hypothetical protein QBC40DRAFT_261458 [Triangularia verruculosa]